MTNADVEKLTQVSLVSCRHEWASVGPVHSWCRHCGSLKYKGGGDEEGIHKPTLFKTTAPSMAKKIQALEHAWDRAYSLFDAAGHAQTDFSGIIRFLRGES